MEDFKAPPPPPPSSSSFAVPSSLTPSQALGTSTKSASASASANASNSSNNSTSASEKKSLAPCNLQGSPPPVAAAAEGSSSNGNSNDNSNKRNKNNRRRNGKKQGNNNNNNNSSNGQDDDGGGKPKASNNNGGDNAGGEDQAQPNNNNKGKGRRNRGKKVKNNGSSNNNEEDSNLTEASHDPSPANQNANANANNKKGGHISNKRKPRKRYPWRRFLPPGTVDPITLEELTSLTYPPFALCANEPYEPVRIWPVKDNQKTKQQQQNQKGTEPQLSVEELNRRRIQEQWSSQTLNGDKEKEKDGDDDSSDKKKKNQTDNASPPPPEKRHYNLYDGRALAYYLVSQLQFIDPLNRRDLTRPELTCLDDYLQRHGFKDLRVTEAYDAKGITLSSAGAAAATAQGRADILQQMASNLLNTLFGGQSVGATTTTPTPAPQNQSNNNNSTLQDQYAALRLQEEEQMRQRDQRLGLNPHAVPFGEAAIYTSEDGGFMIIDDDEFPGLRGGGDYHHQRRTNNNNNSYTDSLVTRRPVATAEAFPALGAPAAPQPVDSHSVGANTKNTNNNNNNNNKMAAKKSKTLSRISGAVKKTNPDEVQRQWLAREDARKRALLANLAFGVNNPTLAAMKSVPDSSAPPTPLVANSFVSDQKLERNKAFADALGVKPATVRQQINSGWTRPTDGKSTGMDEFGNELSDANYPESLIAEAREQVGVLLKIEKKWKVFLGDDKAASVPLNPMLKPARKFIHEYSDFWQLRTESFDPEPKRYIHCVKMLDTRMPYPLLSDVARNWRGPLAVPTIRNTSIPRSDHTSQQTAGQPTRSREIPLPPDRVPLSLKPRTLPPGEQKPDRMSPPPQAGLVECDEANSRFGDLFSERERPKIELNKRTKPLELPAFQGDGYNGNLEADRKDRQAKQEGRVRKEREAANQKRRALEDAFASDDESNGQDSGSDWSEPEPVFTGSDDEDN